jgi:hypothetical protein
MNSGISREKWLALIVVGYIEIIDDFSNTFPSRLSREGVARKLPAVTFVDSVNSSGPAAPPAGHLRRLSAARCGAVFSGVAIAGSNSRIEAAVSRRNLRKAA